ncbi:MAG: patatin-like phospholipase family protein [Anaerolineaceae bacterium]|nr:MAG: patatin-like phospholipase family protein [Anaerolineaceae bacterium]
MQSSTRFIIALLLLLLVLLAACNGEGEKVPSPASTDITSFDDGSDGGESSVSLPVIASGSGLQYSEDGLDIVFSGGGAKSIAQVGALKELEERGITYRRVVGTSSGSIMALMVAAGYSADEMVAAMSERTPDGKIILAKFMDVPQSFDDQTVRESLLFAFFEHFLDTFLPLETADKLDESAMHELLEHEALREAFSFIEFGGVYAGEAFFAWLIEKLDEGGRNYSDLTLAEFHEATGNDLTAIITDVTDHKMLIINHRTAPDLPVAWLIRMSMSIPFVYNHVAWQSEWGTYLGADISGHDIVDGGVGSNFGIEMVVSHEPEFIEAMGIEPDRDRVVGLFLNDEIMVEGAEGTKPDEEAQDDPMHSRWSNVKERNQALLTTLLKNHDHFIVRTHPDVVCHLPVGGFDTLEFDMSDERIALLMESGREAMRQCLEEMELE